MNRKWNYHLFDNGGVSLCEDQEILLPIGTLFRHEYGFYKVVAYRNDQMEEETRYSLITNVECDREYKN